MRCTPHQTVPESTSVFLQNGSQTNGKTQNAKRARARPVLTLKPGVLDPADSLFDFDEMRSALTLMMGEDGAFVTEIRILDGVMGGDRWPNTLNGFFNNSGGIMKALQDVASFKGIYIIPNAVKPALLARRCNRLQKAGKGDGVTDRDIVTRRWLLIDIDPTRDTGISATNQESLTAWMKTQQLFEFLMVDLKFPAPIIAFSGNGFHLNYRIELPAEDGGLIVRCLQALDAKFSDASVKIDVSVGNPARIWKLYGSAAHKGDSTTDRPWRMARVLYKPHQGCKIVHVSRLEALAALAPESVVQMHTGGVGTGTGFIDRFIVEHNLKLGPVSSYQGGRKWELYENPLCAHNDGEVWLIELPSGALSAGCQHQSCTWDWNALREKLDPVATRGMRASIKGPGGGVTTSTTKKPPAAKEDPAVVSACFLDANQRDGLSLIRYWSGSWWQWRDGAYRLRTEQEMRTAVLRFFDAGWSTVRSRYIGDVLEHLKAATILQNDTNAPAWLSAAPNGWRAEDCIAAPSHVLHLPSAAMRNGNESVPATPSFFVTSAIDYTPNEAAVTPSKWLQFLTSIWGEDQESIGCLQEIAGYLLTGKLSHQKIFVIVGPKRSGKGTIGRVLSHVIGLANICAPTISGLATNFGCSTLIGKSVALISDARISGRTDQAVAVERLLSISGEDVISIDRKYAEPITVKLPTRFLLLTNEIPKLADAGGALASRTILLKMTRSFLNREILNLTDELVAERATIFRWAIEGWRRLTARGRFVQPKSGLELTHAWQELGSPVGNFASEECLIEPDASVDAPDIFRAWTEWARDAGFERPGDIAVFGRNLLAAVPSVQRKRRRLGTRRSIIYHGIRLRRGDA